MLQHPPESAVPETGEYSAQHGLRWMLLPAVAPTDLQHSLTIFTGHTTDDPGRPMVLCWRSYGEQQLDAPNNANSGRSHHQINH